MSCTWYVMEVLLPGVAARSATKVTTPVDVFNVYVPSPAITTTPSASQVAGDEPGVIKHVAVGIKPALEVARPPCEVIVVNVAVAPGITLLVSEVATGTAGAMTVDVMVACVTWPVESATTYFTGVAVPLNVSNGSKVTVPFGFTVYVPSFGIVKEARLQFTSTVLVVAHNFRLEGTKVAGEVTVSFVSGEIT